jgi:hypothetical protein
MSNGLLILSALGGAALACVLLVVVVLKFALPKLLLKGAAAMFGAKAAALKGASVRIASVGPAEGPPRQAFASDQDHSDALQTPRSGGRWVAFEATVTPLPPAGEGFTHWEPDELSVLATPKGGKLSLDQLSGDDEIECFIVRQGDLTPGAEGAEEEMKIQGPCQVMVTAYVPNGVNSISLHYYTELLGEPIALP